MMRAFVAAGLALWTSTAHAACSEDVVSVFGDFGTARFMVELADEPEERARGLMFVEQMPLLSGMLFVYESPREATFWMRNTLISLDMLFIDSAGVIKNIHQEAIPGDETTINGGTGIAAVLEINGGLADRLGIAEGDFIQHPSFGADSVMPCAN